MSFRYRLDKCMIAALFLWSTLVLSQPMGLSATDSTAISAVNLKRTTSPSTTNTDIPLSTGTGTVQPPGAGANASASTYLANAEAALDTLQNSYNETIGLWVSFPPSWWQSANALTTLADMVQSGSPKAQSIAHTVFENTYGQAAAWNIEHSHGLKKRAAESGYINGFYDDEGWWAMAWIRVYDATGNETYLQAAETIFADMTTGWGTSCGPDGLWWDKAHTKIAAISNVLFLEVAAWLANRVASKKQFYVSWAEKEWAWLENTGIYMADRQLVGGGLDVQTCKTPAGAHGHTYAQGALVSGLAALTTATSNQTYLATAHEIAAAVMQNMTLNGILTEPHIDQAHPGDSAPQFKGVFMRGLMSLQAQSPRTAYQTFAQQIANSIWSNDRSGAANLGPDWSGPFYGPPNASPQSSALDALVAAWEMTKS